MEFKGLASGGTLASFFCGVSAMVLILRPYGIAALSETIAGNVFVSQKGRQTARGLKVPVRPRTAAQQAEVNHVSRAARTFAYTLSSGQRFDNFAALGPGLVGLGNYLAYSSSISTPGVPPIGPVINPTPLPGPVITSPVVCAGTATVTMQVASAGSPAGTTGFLMASPPLPPGRFPTVQHLRMIHSGFTFPAVLDVGAQYLNRFGSISAGGFVLFAVRAVNPLTNQMSGFGTALAVAACGGSSSCWIDSPIGITPPLSALTVNAHSDFDESPPSQLVTLSVNDPTLSVAFGNPMVNHVTSAVGILDLTGVVRSGSAIAVFTTQGTLFECSFPFSYSVS